MEQREYSRIFRVMHWSIAICMILLLCTIFLRMTWLNKEHVADIIQQFMVDKNTNFTRDELIILAKQIRKPMWNWHIYLGYAITILYIIRMSLPFFGHMSFSNPLNKTLSPKVKFQYWVYMIFYGCLAISLITGLIIEWGPKIYKKPMESVHVLSIYYLVAFMVLHVGGVIWAELHDYKGLISRVISGANGK